MIDSYDWDMFKTTDPWWFARYLIDGKSVELIHIRRFEIAQWIVSQPKEWWKQDFSQLWSQPTYHFTDKMKTIFFLRWDQ